MTTKETEEQATGRTAEPLALFLTEELGVWLPIATAPRDGTRIIVCIDQEVQISVWRRMHNGNENWGADDGESVYMAGWFRPTHWMPLPPPPRHA